MIPDHLFDKLLSMELADFKIGELYTQKDLIDAFGGSFLRPRGITPINSQNLIILISYHYGRNTYEDKLFENDVMYYSGEGTDKDQTLVGRNKSVYEAKNKGKKIILFVVLKKGEYKFFGEVVLVGEPKYKVIEGSNNNAIRAIRFPLMLKTAFRHLTREEMERLSFGGVTPIEKPILQVVGAAIMRNKNELLCAQRGYGSLIGKWEFPGGKIEGKETPEQALAREIKEELNIDIEVGELLDENYNEYPDKNINIKVYRCKYISGEIKKVEHKALKWATPEEVEKLDWAEADIPIVETYLESLEKNIISHANYDYFEAEAVNPSKKDIQRAVQDYEKAQRAKQKSGDKAEEAVLRYERDKLNNLGRPELAELVKQESKENSAAGYDIKSYDVKDDGSFVETHIEVKSANQNGKYIEFFISKNELDKFKDDPNHKIYCLFKFGRNYKLHEVNKDNFFRNNYLSPMTYRVRIRVAQ